MLTRKPSRALSFQFSSYKVCTVGLLNGQEKSFQIDKASKGQYIFDLVCSHLDLFEREYFGLAYPDPSGYWFWLSPDKKISKQLKCDDWRVDFQVKFYPPEPMWMKEPISRYYLYLQVRQDILSCKLLCSFHTLIILGSYVAQSEIGNVNIDEESHLNTISQIPFAPERLQTVELLSRIIEMQRLHTGETAEDMEIAFLQNAKKLALYGVSFQKCNDCINKEEVFVGVYHSGILVYRGRLRIKRFSWSKITRLSYSKNCFQIFLRSINDSSLESGVEFKCVTDRLAKRLWKLCVEHHSFFRLRETFRTKRTRINVPWRRFTYYGTSAGYHLQRNNSHANTLSSTDGTPSVCEGQVRSAQRVLMRRKQDHFYNQLEGGCLSSSRSRNHIDGAAACHSDYLTSSCSASSVSHRRPQLPPPEWRVCASDRSAGLMIESNSGLAVATAVATAGEDNWLGCRSNWGVQRSGQFYYEASIMGQGPVRLGWATNTANLRLGEDALSFVYGSSEDVTNGIQEAEDRPGVKVHAGAITVYGEELVSGDVVGCFLDLNKGTVTWSRNGKEMGPGYRIPLHLRNVPFFPACSVKDSSVVFNFGSSPFLWPPISCWLAVCEAPVELLASNQNQSWKISHMDLTPHLTLAPDCLTVQAYFGPDKQGVRCCRGVRSRGRYYFEVTVLELSAYCTVVGWVCELGSLDLGSDRLGFGFGIQEDKLTHSSQAISNGTCASASGALTQHGGRASHSNSNSVENQEIECFNVGDVIGCFLDLDSWIVCWSLNGKESGNTYRIRPDLRNQAFYPAATLKNTTVQFNFGDSPFKFMPEEGLWIPVSTAPEEIVCRSKKCEVENKAKPWSYQVDSAVLEQKLNLRNGQALMRLSDQSNRTLQESPIHLFSQHFDFKPAASSSENMAPIANISDDMPPSSSETDRKALPLKTVICSRSNSLVEKRPVMKELSRKISLRLEREGPDNQENINLIPSRNSESEDLTISNKSGSAEFCIPTVTTNSVRYCQKNNSNNYEVFLTNKIPIVSITSGYYRPSSKSNIDSVCNSEDKPSLANFIDQIPAPCPSNHPAFSNAIFAVTGLSPDKNSLDYSVQYDDYNSQLIKNGWFQDEV